MPATDLWLPDRNSLSRTACNRIQPIWQAITQRDPFINHHQFRSPADSARMTIALDVPRVLPTERPVLARARCRAGRWPAMQLRSRRQAGEQPGRERGDSRDPGITRQMTRPAARVIADEAWAKLLWAGLKLQAACFGNADCYYPQSGSTRMTEASALTKRRDATSLAQRFLASWQEKCRFGGGHFVAGVRAGQRPAPDDKRE